MAPCLEIQGEERIGVANSLWALARKVGLRGMCFSFCQLEFPFQIPFWLYDQATAVFMGGHSLAGGADLVRKEVYSFCRRFKQLQPAAGTGWGGMCFWFGDREDRTWVWKLAPSLDSWNSGKPTHSLGFSKPRLCLNGYGPFLRSMLWLFSEVMYFTEGYRIESKRAMFWPLLSSKLIKITFLHQAF